MALNIMIFVRFFFRYLREQTHKTKEYIISIRMTVYVTVSARSRFGNTNRPQIKKRSFWF